MKPRTFWPVGDCVIWSAWTDSSATQPMILPDDGIGILEVILSEHTLAWRHEHDGERTEALNDLANQLIAAQDAVKDWRRAAQRQGAER